MKINNIKSCIIFLCITDYILTIMGIEIGYLAEMNPIFDIIFSYGQYSFGLFYKILLTMLCLEFFCKYDLVVYMNFCLCLYLSINTIHIIYIILYLMQVITK